MKRVLIAGLCGLVGIATPLVAAAAFPEKLITIVVAATPGNANDLLARAIAAKLTERLKQNVIVENRPGGGGTIGTSTLMRSKPDGYTLMVHSTSLTTSQAMSKAPSYDVERDFTPIVMLANAPMGIFVHPSIPANNLTELVAYGKANPGKLNFGSSGIGSIMHISGELLGLVGGMSMVHVPYQGGAPAVNALMSNEIQALVVDVASALGAVQGGKVKMLAIGSHERLTILPEVPTTAESGLSGYNPAVWYGLFAPAGTPAEVVQLLYDEVSRVTADPTYREDLGKRGSQVPTVTSAQFKALIAAELAKWRDVQTRAKIELQ